MNQLPTHRRALYGRTHSRVWRPEEFAAIEITKRRGLPPAVVAALIITAFVVVIKLV